MQITDIQHLFSTFDLFNGKYSFLCQELDSTQYNFFWEVFLCGGGGGGGGSLWSRGSSVCQSVNPFSGDSNFFAKFILVYIYTREHPNMKIYLKVMSIYAKFLFMYYL